MYCIYPEGCSYCSVIQKDSETGCSACLKWVANRWSIFPEMERALPLEEWDFTLPESRKTCTSKLYFVVSLRTEESPWEWVAYYTYFGLCRGWKGRPGCSWRDFPLRWVYVSFTRPFQSWSGAQEMTFLVSEEANHWHQWRPIII